MANQNLVMHTGQKDIKSKTRISIFVSLLFRFNLNIYFLFEAFNGLLKVIGIQKIDIIVYKMYPYQSSWSQSLNPLANGLLAIFNWVI